MSDTAEARIVAPETVDLVAAQLTAAIIIKGTGDAAFDRQRTNETAAVNLFFEVKANLLTAHATAKTG